MFNFICVYLSHWNTETLTPNRISAWSIAHPQLRESGLQLQRPWKWWEHNARQDSLTSETRKRTLQVLSAGSTSDHRLSVTQLPTHRKDMSMSETAEVKNRSVPKKVEEKILGGRRGLNDIKTNKQWDEDPNRKNKPSSYVNRKGKTKRLYLPIYFQINCLFV